MLLNVATSIRYTAGFSDGLSRHRNRCEFLSVSWVRIWLNISWISELTAITRYAVNLGRRIPDDAHFRRFLGVRYRHRVVNVNQRLTPLTLIFVRINVNGVALIF